jgi:hypothetical protein
MPATRALMPPSPQQAGLAPRPAPNEPRQAGVAPHMAGRESPGRTNAVRPQGGPPARRVPAAPTPAGIKTKLGAANEPGMGLPAAPAKAPLGLVPPPGSLDGPFPSDQMLRADGGDRPLGDDPLTFPCEQVGGALVAPFSCSRATFDFLRGNVLRNPGDIQVIILYGLQKFDRRTGQHQIALDRGGRDTPNAITRDGAIVVPDGKAFIVTDFVGAAFESVFGLPGALRSIDPASLSMNLCFSLVQQNGQQALPQSALLGGLGGHFCNGTPFLNDSAVFGYPALTQTIRMPAQALYTVQVPPYPGFPDVIGARVKGYLVNQQLLAAVQDRPVTNG